jgi:hypothetical protein
MRYSKVIVAIIRMLMHLFFRWLRLVSGDVYKLCRFVGSAEAAAQLIGRIKQYQKKGLGGEGAVLTIMRGEFVQAL